MNMIERYLKSLGENTNSTLDHNTKGHLNDPLDHNAKNAIYIYINESRLYALIFGGAQ